MWFGRVSGGVDVFFLVSGFLMTGQLLRTVEGGQQIRPVQRWRRTFVRLLPQMLAVLVVTGVAGLMLLPEGRWGQTIRELVASAVFLENWQLAADTVDYEAQHNTASVVQHFWSLSIQGQFFVAWPLLVALVALVARGVPGRVRGYLTLAVLGLFVGSLGYSIELTATDQPLAYFHSLTRLWEFALGGLLALWIDRVTWSVRARIWAGWLGAAGLVACGVVLPVSAVFPGFAALWPTGAAALVLLAGATGSTTGVDRWLASRPARYLGDISFPLYLWHWPVLIFWLVGADQDTLGWLDGLGVIAVSVLLAALTQRLFDRRAMRGVRMSAVGLVAVLVTVGAWQLLALDRAVPSGVVGDAEHPGALALYDAAPARANLLPPPVTVYDDWVRVENWQCAPLARFPMDACAQPVTGEPERRIVVVGDSHVQQLAGALVPIARQRNWQLISIVRGACPFSTASEVVPDDADCLAWLDAAAGEIADLAPDAVVTLASRNVRAGLTEQTPSGFVEQWRRLADLGIPVLAVRDNPRFDFSVPDCVETFGRGSARCGVDRELVYAPVPPYAQLTDVPPNVSFLDVADAICDEARCPAVVGNVLVYLDDNHVSASYATSMAPLVEGAVAEAIG